MVLFLRSLKKDNSDEIYGEEGEWGSIITVINIFYVFISALCILCMAWRNGGAVLLLNLTSSYFDSLIHGSGKNRVEWIARLWNGRLLNAGIRH